MDRFDPQWGACPNLFDDSVYIPYHRDDMSFMFALCIFTDAGKRPRQSNQGRSRRKQEGQQEQLLLDWFPALL